MASCTRGVLFANGTLVHFGGDDVSLYGTPKEELGPSLMSGGGPGAGAAATPTPGETSSKPSFLKNQLQALFQPTDNKLAMKLFGSKKALMKERIRQKAAGHWVIHPCSSFRFYWDLCMLLLLVANLIILPVAISFFNDDLSTRWIAFNCLSDTIFLIDIVVNFRTGIMQQDNAEQVILDPKIIAKNYLKTWFFLDLISSIPLDYIFLIFNQDFSESFQILHAGRALRILRLAKLLSLVRLLRLSRLVRYVSQWEEVYLPPQPSPATFSKCDLAARPLSVRSLLTWPMGTQEYHQCRCPSQRIHQVRTSVTPSLHIRLIVQVEFHKCVLGSSDLAWCFPLGHNGAAVHALADRGMMSSLWSRVCLEFFSPKGVEERGTHQRYLVSRTARSGRGEAEICSTTAIEDDRGPSQPRQGMRKCMEEVPATLACLEN